MEVSFCSLRVLSTPPNYPTPTHAFSEVRTFMFVTPLSSLCAAAATKMQVDELMSDISVLSIISPGLLSINSL